MLDRIGQFLEREGGYHVVSLVLIIIGVCIVDSVGRGQIGRDLVVFGLGVLARSMAGKALGDKPSA